MVIDPHAKSASHSNSTDSEPASRCDDRDSDRHRANASSTAREAKPHDLDAEQVGESRERHALPSSSESNYAAPASPDAPAPPNGLRIELPQHDPVITPGAARALLRLVLKAAGGEQPASVQPPPPWSIG